MVHIKNISDADALYAIEHHDLDSSIINSRVNVVVILTQGWCPQWKSMNEWLKELDTVSDINVFVLVYDKTSYFKEFVSFKEKIFKNFEIPYLRFYKSGKLVKESNYLSPASFKSIFE